MSVSENEEIKDWICNNPTENEIRFIDDSDVISCDSSDSDKVYSIRAKKYNELSLTGKRVYKLLRSARPQGNKCWRKAEIEIDLLNTINQNSDSEYSIRSDSCDININNSNSAEKCNQLLTRSKQKYLHSPKRRGKSTWSKLEVKVVDSKEKYPEYKCEIVSPRRMGKNHKRIREVSVTDESEASSTKKIKIFDKKSISKTVKTHSVSSSEGEESNKNSVRKSKGHGDKNKSNRNLSNTHLLSSESDCIADQSFGFTSNEIPLENSFCEDAQVIDSECESDANSEKDLNVKNTQKATSDKYDSKERVSSGSMAKIHKRKRELSVTDEREACSSKKIKSNDDKLVSKTVKRKEKSHSVSSSEGEESDRNSTAVENEGHCDKNKSSTKLSNTHLLSSECDSVGDQSYEFTPNKENAVRNHTHSVNNEYDSDDDSEKDLKVKNVQSTTSAKSDSRERLHQIPKFTSALNEEISKFSLLLDDNLIEKNDIWILQCPSNMNYSALVGQRLSLGSSCQLDDGERTYETYSYRNTNTRSSTLAVPSERNHLNLYKIPITGNIIVEESVNIAKNTQETIPEIETRVGLPENLRTRHPLLGIDFSKQSRTAERVAENSPKKKKHSKNHGRSYNGVIESEFGSPSISSHSKKNKKKKQISNEVVSQSDNTEQLVEECVDDSPKKKKKKKKHKDTEV